MRIKFGARRICNELRNIGISAAEIHSNRSLSQRREALEGFKLGRYRVLVATDIASRGIDVKGIELVINFDLPENPEDYVHVSEEPAGLVWYQGSKVRDIEKLTRLYLPVSKLPDLPPDLSQQSKPFNNNFNKNKRTLYRNRPTNRFSYNRRR